MGNRINKRSSQTRNSNQMEASVSNIYQSHQQEHLPPTDNTVLLNPDHSVENLLKLINEKEEKINGLTTRVAFSSSAIIATNRRFLGYEHYLAWEYKLWSNLYQMLWSSLQYWTTAFKKFQEFGHEIGSQHIFQTSSSDKIFYIYQWLEGLGMRKILTHVIRMQRIHKTARTFWQIFIGLFGVQSLTCTPTWKFHQ